ncbi:MAG TPA: SurA N-terminal domain-containing protein [Candidatus Hydrogenedens sp.]|nr:SurA N-terminal domain-containing protein [Candidatus Hydrogenedens sp.]
MIQELMRKHRRAILIFVVIVIAVPFVLFFGMPGRNSPTVQIKDNPVATVSKLPVLESEFRRNLNALIQQRSTPDKPVTIEELEKSGETDRLLQQMIDSNLITLEEQKRGFQVDRNLLVEQMQKWQQFRTEDGKFDREAWNAWVDANKGKINWNEIYNELQNSISRQVFINTLLAPARFDSTAIEKRVKNNFTRIHIKYAKISPPVEIKDEELSKYFEEHKEVYRNPDTLVIEAVKLSLQPPVPDKVKEAYEKAMQGEDFATLADTYSDQKTKNGGDIGWQTPRENEPPHRQVLFSLKVGEISAPIYTFGAFYIFKLEEERTNAETNAREVHARQIMVRASLSNEEKKQKENEANEIVKRANEEKTLEKVAQEKGLSITKIGPFNKDSKAVEGITQFDLYPLCNAFMTPEKDSEYQVITARDNIYVAKVFERTKGEIPSLEQVRERVVGDYTTMVKKQEDYKKKVDEIVNKIKAEAKTIDDLPKILPDLQIEVKETSQAFTAKDYLFQEGLMISPEDIFNELEGKDVGALAGPIKDFNNEYYFVQLLERTLPTEEDKPKMEEEKKKMLDMEIRMAQNEILNDYLLYLRENAMKSGIPIKINQQLISSILGENKKTEEKEGAEKGKKAPATTTSDLEKLNTLIGD